MINMAITEMELEINKTKNFGIGGMVYQMKKKNWRKEDERKLQEM